MLGGFIPNKNRALKKLEEKIVKQNVEGSTEEFEELEHEVSEDPRESSEGMGIEKEEKAGEEPYPEIEKELEHEDKPEKEDEDEED